MLDFTLLQYTALAVLICLVRPERLGMPITIDYYAIDTTSILDPDYRYTTLSATPDNIESISLVAGIITTADESQPSPSTDSDEVEWRAIILQFCPLTPANSPYCYDPSFPPPPSQTQWQKLYADINNPYGTGDATTCQQIWSSSFYQWITYATDNNIFTPFISASALSPGEPFPLFVAVTQLPKDVFTAEPPCCSSCTVTIGDAQVYHWPISGYVSTLVNENGFTFISPSIYVSFQTVGAFDLCGGVGPSFTGATTIAVDYLWTSMSYTYNTTMFPAGLSATPEAAYPLSYAFTTASWESSITCTDITTATYYNRHLPTLYSDSTWPLYKDWEYTTETEMSLANITYNPCRPWLSLGYNMLNTVRDSAWQSCVVPMQSLRDPWTALSDGPGFSPITSHITTSEYPTPISPASAAPTLLPITATRTPPPVAYPTTSPAIIHPSAPILKLLATITIARTTIIANSQSLFVLGTQTLFPGQQVTYSQTVLSLASNGQSLDIDGTSTVYFTPSYLIGTQTITAGGPELTDSGLVYSVESNGILSVENSTQAAEATSQILNTAIQPIWVLRYIIDNQTLIAGGLPITSSGTVLSLEPDGKNIIKVISITEDINAWLRNSPTETKSSGGSASSTEIHQNEANGTILDAPGSTRMAAGRKNDACRVVPDVYTITLLMAIAFIRI